MLLFLFVALIIPLIHLARSPARYELEADVIEAIKDRWPDATELEVAAVGLSDRRDEAHAAAKVKAEARAATTPPASASILPEDLRTLARDAYRSDAKRFVLKKALLELLADDTSDWGVRSALPEALEAEGWGVDPAFEFAEAIWRQAKDRHP